MYVLVKITILTLLTVQLSYVVDTKGLIIRIGDNVISTGILPEQINFTLSEESKGSVNNRRKVGSGNEIIQAEEIKDLRCNLDPKIVSEITGYKEIVTEIIQYVTVGDFKGKTYEILAQLTDTFGSRMTGTKELEDSIDWMIEKFQDQRLENVHTELVAAPHWVRNNESLNLIKPRYESLSILGLGSSVGTPPGGITAEVIVVKSFQELKANKDKAFGRIVVFNPDWESYGETVQYRAHAASHAAQVGALASLIRSVAPFSINSPHTGWQHYSDKTRRIPAACITIEDAQMMQRFQDRGEKLVVNLTMGAENLPHTVSRNTVAEVIGYERPDEVVVVSGHLDSWDIGVGAMDDGGGSMISWGTTAVLKQLGLRARRTIRTVLFTAEEQGLFGGRAYFEEHSKNLKNFQLLLESDFGTFDPQGLSFSGTRESQCIMKEILSLMAILNATKLTTPMKGGPDIQVWERAGVPTGSISTDNSRYFWFHHSAGDTMEVEDSESLDKCAALWTAVAFIVADMTTTLPR